MPAIGRRIEQWSKPNRYGVEDALASGCDAPAGGGTLGPEPPIGEQCRYCARKCFAVENGLGRAGRR
jgi:hypothetical protein